VNVDRVKIREAVKTDVAWVDIRKSRGNLEKWKERQIFTDYAQ
jgi:hypothetical protein